MCATEMAWRFSYLKKFFPTSLVRIILGYVGKKESTPYRYYFYTVK